MEKGIERALNAIRSQYPEVSEGDFNALVATYENHIPFMDKVKQLDEAIAKNEVLNGLSEVLFDLLIVNFLSTDVKALEEDYLESPEWMDIEEKTIDRGTELLNLFLYIAEANDLKVKPSLEDYLKEFLLVDEDEFQDEYLIYEQVIANQLLMESDLSEISRIARSLDIDNPLKELFYPLMGFFYNPNPREEDLKEYQKHALEIPEDWAIYDILVAYHNNI